MLSGLFLQGHALHEKICHHRRRVEDDVLCPRRQKTAGKLRLAGRGVTPV